MTNQVRFGQPSLIMTLADRSSEDSDQEACNKALAALESLPVKEYTGGNLWKRDPRRYGMIVRMISECLSARMIARACGVSVRTVEAVRQRERFSIQKEREQILKTVRAGARVCAEKVLELAPTMDAKQAAIAFNIFVAKMLSLQEEATSITIKKDELSHKTFNDLIAALPAAKANVIEASNAEHSGEANQE
jgi:hypothetical protein